MSSEGFERFIEGVRSESGEKILLPSFKSKPAEDLEDNDLPDFLETIFSEGTPVVRTENCTNRDCLAPPGCVITPQSYGPAHGPFTRHGWLWRNWLVWKGNSPAYSNSYSKDAGCSGCRASSEKHTAEYFARGDEAEKAKAIEFAQDWPVGFFQCEVAEECGIHGPFVNKVSIIEMGAWR